MPEIGEIARTVHFLRTHLKNRRIAKVLTKEDSIVFNAKADGTTHTSFAAALTGKTVLDARQQGKYFWLVMSSPPHPLFHFGMTGWISFKGVSTFYKGEENEAGDEEDVAEEKDRKAKNEEWPPKFMKFVLQMEGEPECEAAFVDKRRLARIRLIDAAAEDMRNTSPLVENGPDPVIDKKILTAEWLATRLKSKKVPVKAFLLDQAVISGVGNWVGDEVLYHAKIHPEQYSNTLTDAQMKQLHESLGYVCGLACDTLSDSSKFPKEWLFKHRWNKGKKGESMNILPNGEKIVHLKVGGRTSAIVPTVQKKTGPVAGDVDGEEDEEGGEKKVKKSSKAPAKNSKRKVKEESPVEDGEEDDEGQKVKKSAKKSAKAPVKKAKRKLKEESPPEEDEDEDEEEEAEEETKKPRKKPKQEATPKSTKAKNAPTKAKPQVKPSSVKEEAPKSNGTRSGTRKSSRLSGA